MKQFKEGTVVHLHNIKNGHYKFYDMFVNGDETWTAYWGAIGTRGQEKDYEGDLTFYSKLDEKLNKGYEEISYGEGRFSTYEEHKKWRDF